MTTTKHAGASLLEVRLSDGTRWRGTQAQLRRVHPDWLPYAQPVPQHVQHHPASSPYAGHLASIYPENAPFTTDDQYADDHHARDDDADLSGYPNEMPRAAPPSAVRHLQRYQEFPYTQVDVHEGPPPLVRRASRRQPNPKRPAPDDGTVYQMPAAGGWHPHTEAPAAQATSRPKQKRSRRRVHPLLTLGLGMLVMLTLWQVGIQITVWWQLHQEDATYGRPRTYQTDAVVGHFDSATHPSHFLAENLHRRVVVFELAGGDASRTRVYVGPLLYGPDADLAPVTLAFPLIGGKVAMIVNVQGTHIVYLNQNVKGVWQFVQQQG